LDEKEIEKRNIVKARINAWPDGKLKQRAMNFLSKGYYYEINEIVPPGTEVKYRDGSSYIVDRNGTYIKTKKGS